MRYNGTASPILSCMAIFAGNREEMDNAIRNWGLVMNQFMLIF